MAAAASLASSSLYPPLPEALCLKVNVFSSVLSTDNPPAPANVISSVPATSPVPVNLNVEDVPVPCSADIEYP